MKVLHMSGAGNDFMVIDGRGLTADYGELSKKLCAITGADGFMAVDTSEIAHFKLHFYNSDGTRGEMCGNGSRCVSKYAYDLGLAPECMTIETDAGLLESRRMDAEHYQVKLNSPSVLAGNRLGDMAYVELGNPGIPHGVLHYPGLTWEMRDALRETMRAQRFAPAFPKGANINYYDWLGENRVRILTFERGVEDFTLACGTGSGSVAAWLYASGKLPEGSVTVENPGGTLEFRLCGQGSAMSILMTGPAVVLAEYDL